MSFAVRFRRVPNCADGAADAASLSLDAARQTVAQVCRPAHFFAQGMSLCWKAETEEIAWELFRGRLLDAAMTRQRRRFQSWNVFQITDDGCSPEPVLSVKLDAEAGELHVVRALPCHAWEAYDAGGNVIQSRETIKWVRELVGTIALADLGTMGELRDELAGLLFQATVGTSRLPLTSIESPLPEFTFGRLGYVFRSDMEAMGGDACGMQSWPDLLERGLNADLCAREQVKLLELLIRAVPPPDLASAALRFTQRWQSLGRPVRDIAALWREMFNEVSLSPYTDFTEKSLALLGILVEQKALTVPEQIDCLSGLLRQLGRHLTAYDLVTFHHRGANYPDALLLDAVLKAYVDLSERHPPLFLGAEDAREQRRQRLRRRALRQACLLRFLYAGHPVPDAPTSDGENSRVLPAPYVRVPPEQILHPAKRSRRLYAADPLARRVPDTTRMALQQALDDLEQPHELAELGTAVFVDRPLGIGKPAGAPDQTPLLAHQAFSRTIAARRLRDLERLASELGLRFDLARNEERLTALPSPGLALSELWTPERSTVSLADARRVADDFMLVRTADSSVQAILNSFSFAEVGPRLGLDFLGTARLWLLPVGEGRLAVFDAAYRKRLEVEPDRLGGLRIRGGVELPAGGLRLVRVWRELSTGELQPQAASAVIE